MYKENLRTFVSCLPFPTESIYNITGQKIPFPLFDDLNPNDFNDISPEEWDTELLTGIAYTRKQYLKRAVISLLDTTDPEIKAQQIRDLERINSYN